MDTVDLIIKSSMEFYNDLKADENGRYRSWEHCYSHFIKARESKEVDYDYLSLQLAFYLASWGMYRGSSFLLQKDYRVHVPVVKELLNKKYDALAGIECAAFKEESNQKLLQDINSFLEKYYDKIRHEVKEQEIKNQLSYTLITKILSLAFLLLFVSGVLVRPVFSPVFSVSEPEAQRGDRRRRGKGDDGHQHIAARVLPQQHCAEAAPCGGLPRSDKCVCRLHQHREQQHTRCGEAYCLVPLPSAGVFPHTLLDECDPSFGIVHIV